MLTEITPYLGSHEVGTDEWLLARLLVELNARNRGGGRGVAAIDVRANASSRPGMDQLWDYMRGEPPLPECADGWRDAMWPWLRLSRMNYAGMAIRSIAERLVPIGWHTAVDDDPDGDQKAAEVAGVNEFDVVVGDVLEAMLWAGETYMMVTPPQPGETVPTVTAEDPRECIVRRDRVSGRPVAGLKVDRDDWTGDLRFHLFTPGRVRVAGNVGGRFDWIESLSGRTLPDRIPLVPFTNKGGVGEFERHLDTLDRVNDAIFTRVTIMKYQAFRQRAVKVPKFDEKGDEVDYTGVFTADPGSMWQVPLDADFWESTPVDLTPILSATKDDVAAFASAVGIPLFWISPDAANGSAAGADTMREGNEFRGEDRQRRANSGFAELLSQCFLRMGDRERSERWKIRTIWAPTQRYSIEARGSAAVAYISAGMPFEEMLVDVMQKTPNDVARVKALRDQELLFSEPAPSSPNAVAGQLGAIAGAQATQERQQPAGKPGPAQAAGDAKTAA